MNKWYFEKNGEFCEFLHMEVSTLFSPIVDTLVQASVAQVFFAISENSLDVANSSMADFIPLVFLAMHATVAEEGDVFLHIHVHICIFMYLALHFHLYRL